MILEDKRRTDSRDFKYFECLQTRIVGEENILRLWLPVIACSAPHQCGVAGDVEKNPSASLLRRLTESHTSLTRKNYDRRKNNYRLQGSTRREYSDLKSLRVIISLNFSQQHLFHCQPNNCMKIQRMSDCKGKNVFFLC